MARDGSPWTLEDLIEFEQALSHSAVLTSEEKQLVSASIAGKSTESARQIGLKTWLDGRRTGIGRKFTLALDGVSLGLFLLALSAGITTVLGLYRWNGINVTIFVAVVLGVQIAILIGASVAWLFRRKAGEAYSVVQSIIGVLARRLTGDRESVWWQSLITQGGAGRRALLWRLARVVQTAGIVFNLGAIAALVGLVLFRNVGFFWETTTESAMRGWLEQAVNIIAAPWSWLDPASAPDARLIDGTRWWPEKSPALSPGPAAWWRFLLWSLVVWGLLPRLILRFLCQWNEGRSLAALDFQSRHHRTLWRELTGGEARGEIAKRPTDGALVIDVGGAGFSNEALRPFLLQKLRVNPTAWETTGVLDPEREAAARNALTDAPAAIVLLVEGWALSPRQVESLLAKVSGLKEDRRVILLIGIAEPNGEMRPAEEDERANWKRFVDGLAGSEVELVFYEGGAR
jgi:hypothetical protein